MEFRGNNLTLKLNFYLDAFLYEYTGIFSKIENNKVSIENRYASIKDLNLYRMKYERNKKNHLWENFEQGKEDVSSIFDSSLSDTSALKKLTGGQIKVDSFSNNNLSNSHETILRSSFFFSLNTCSSRLVSSIIRLLDDSVKSLTALNSQFVKFKRFNEKEEFLANEDLMKILSAGTFRGVELYIRSSLL